VVDSSASKHFGISTKERHDGSN